MRNFLLTMVAMVCLLPLQAQDNVIKLGISNLVSSNIPLAYERVLTDNMSVQVIAAFRIPRTVPGQFTGQDGAPAGNSESSFGGFSVTPELRFYTGGDAPTGFYVGPYLRYRNWNYGVDLTTLDNLSYNASGNWNAIAGGAVIGMQWILGDVFSIDWTILGLGVAYQTLKGDFTTDDPTLDLQDLLDEVNTTLADVPVVGDRLSAAVENNAISANLGFLFVNARAALAVGYAF